MHINDTPLYYAMRKSRMTEYLFIAGLIATYWHQYGAILFDL